MKSVVKNKSFAFALHIIELYKVLQNKKEYVLSKQLLRSGTSIGANINEALAAESNADFVHKMSLASKEARETLYWLQLLNKSQMVTYNYQLYVEECTELVKILTSIVKTAQEKH